MTVRNEFSRLSETEVNEHGQVRSCMYIHAIGIANLPVSFAHVVYNLFYRTYIRTSLSFNEAGLRDRASFVVKLNFSAR